MPVSFFFICGVSLTGHVDTFALVHFNCISFATYFALQISWGACRYVPVRYFFDELSRLLSPIASDAVPLLNLLNGDD